MTRRRLALALQSFVETIGVALYLLALVSALVVMVGGLLVFTALVVAQVVYWIVDLLT